VPSTRRRSRRRGDAPGHDCNGQPPGAAAGHAGGRDDGRERRGREEQGHEQARQGERGVHRQQVGGATGDAVAPEDEAAGLQRHGGRRQGDTDRGQRDGAAADGGPFGDERLGQVGGGECDPGAR
jgi:hypothetical protein